MLTDRTATRTASWRWSAACLAALALVCGPIGCGTDLIASGPLAADAAPVDADAAVAAVEAVTRTVDGGLIGAGWQQKPGGGASSALVVRRDAAGKPVWQTALMDVAGVGAQRVRLHAIVADGSGVVVAGQRTTSKAAETKTGGWLVKLDLQGNWLWPRALGGNGHDILYGLAVAPTGGFAAVGVRDKASPVTAGDGWLVRLDKSGNTVSETTLKAGGDDVLRMIGWSRLSPAGKSGGWLTAGTQVIEHIGEPNWSSNYDRSQGWVVRLDDKLQVQWQSTIDYYAVETLRGGTVLRDGDLFVVGDTRGGSPLDLNAPPDKPDGLALRVDGLSGEDSCKCGFFERADTASAAPSRLEDVVALPTNTVVAAGWQTATNGLGDGWLQASASDGKPTWSKTYGKAGDDRFSALTADGDGWLLVGFTTSSGAGGKDGWVVRTDGFGTKLIEITLGGPDDDELIDVLKLPNGNWLGVGRSKNQSKGGYDGWVEPKAGERDNWLVHLAADGKVLSDAKPLAPKYQSTTAARLSKAGWLFAGCKDNLAWVGERDAAGKTLWETSTAAVQGTNEIVYGVGNDVTTTADGTIWLQINGSPTVGSNFDNSVALGTAASAWKANYVYSTVFGGYGRMLAQPDNTVIDIRPYCNGGVWVLRWQRLQKPFKILTTVTLSGVTHLFPNDTLQLGNGDLLIAGSGYKTSGAEYGATVWRVTADGKMLWSQAPATAGCACSKLAANCSATARKIRRVSSCATSCACCWPSQSAAIQKSS
ncbi:MAG: hypothetical protein EXR77_13225 [Myxococcales bacterium]|nr:hypothetical protein [Myxococcales bacterium]